LNLTAVTYKIFAVAVFMMVNVWNVTHNVWVCLWSRSVPTYIYLVPLLPTAWHLKIYFSWLSYYYFTCYKNYFDITSLPVHHVTSVTQMS